MAEKPVYEQVSDLMQSWNPPPVDKAMERIVGVPTEPGDGRATAHVPMEELNSHMNAGRDDIDAQRQQYGDDLDDGDDADDDGSEYDDMTIDQLKDALRERDLPVSGNKQELIDRLVEDDEADDEGDDEA
jgi:hypothetical protein